MNPRNLKSLRAISVSNHLPFKVSVLGQKGWAGHGGGAVAVLGEYFFPANHVLPSPVAKAAPERLQEAPNAAPCGRRSKMRVEHTT